MLDLTGLSSYSKFDPDLCIDILDRVPSDASYNYVPEEIQSLWAAIVDEFQEPGFDAFQRITFLRLIEQFETRSRDKGYTPSIRACFDVSFKRILDSIADPEFSLYRTENDILRKDLSLCRQHMFPAGMRIVEPNSGFHRSLVYRGGPIQAFRLVELLFRTGGHQN
jgi:hypothetical protein